MDDEPAVRESVQLLLEAVGLRAELYASAEEFLAALRPDRRGCLVLDVKMPGMSGPDLHERLLELGVRLPVIFITGHGDAATLVKVPRPGVVDLLEKPFDNQRLLDRIHDAFTADFASPSPAGDGDHGPCRRRSAESDARPEPRRRPPDG